MVTALHGDQQLADGIHPIIGIGPYANEAARLGATVASTDIGRVAKQTDTGALWALLNNSPMRWGRVTGPIPIHTDATTARTLSLVDVDAITQFTSSSAVALTFPLASAIPGLQAGDSGLIYCDGTGAVTCTPASGSVHLRRRGGSLVSNGQYSVLSWTYKGSEEWSITGDTA